MFRIRFGSTAMRAVMILAALTAAIAGPAPGDSPGQTSAIEHGRDMYRIYCRTCHGDKGAGDGPTARKLEVRPSDLTRLARDNGGEFPVEEIRTAIDGRQLHRSREMPIWGLAFQELNMDIGQEEQVRERIDQLIEYLRSIQVPPPKD